MSLLIWSKVSRRRIPRSSTSQDTPRVGGMKTTTGT